MLAYQIRIALKSMKRNPVLSTLLVTGIALGIAVSTAFVTIYYVLAGDPVPHKSDRLFHVALDAWDPEEPWDDERPELPPNQLAYRDVRALLESDIPTYQTPMFKSSMTVQPDSEAHQPYHEVVRMCRGDFFTMFEVPFRYGSGWDRRADSGPEPVIVIDADTNRRLFGGGDSVGRELTIEGREFTVVGVLDEWRPAIHYYDVNNNPFEAPEAIYMPFDFVEPMELRTAGNTNGWKYYAGDSFQDLLASERIWLQYWVQLDSAEQRDSYRSFLDAYAAEQRRLGRFQRPPNNRIYSVTEWLEREEVTPESTRAMLIISLLFLVVCSVNLIGILLGKFLARAPEVGVRRALGASRTAVFLQHLLECEVIGLIGGAFGLGLSVLLLRLMNRMLDGDLAVHLDLTMLLAAVALSLGAGLIAGTYPSWRICRVAPASYLKLQ